MWYCPKILIPTNKQSYKVDTLNLTTFMIKYKKRLNGEWSWLNFNEIIDNE